MKNSPIIVTLVLIIIAGTGLTLPSESAPNWNAFKQKISPELLSTYPYSECFQEAAQKHNVPVSLLLSVAKGESNFDPRAVSNKGALGIMQILWPGTARDLGFKQKEELFDPCSNINAGARYLKQMLNRYNGDTYLALCAYYSGPGRISEDNVPDYADDYACYIYAKLSAIQGIAFKQKITCRIIDFDLNLRAESYIEHIKKTDPAIPLEVFKNSLNKYGVCLEAGTQKEMKILVEKIQKITGMKLEC